MGTDKRLAAIRDVLASTLRDASLRIAQIDLSDDEPSREHVEQWVQNVSHELGKAAARGVSVPESVAVYADPKLIAAAVRLSQQTMRVHFSTDHAPVMFAPPPDGYTLGPIEQEIDKAAQEATPTEPPKRLSELPAGQWTCSTPGCTVGDWHRHDELAKASVEGPRAP